MLKFSHFSRLNKESFLISSTKLELKFFRQQSNSQKCVNLIYDLNDKFNSKKALVIAHGLFASKASWKALARRINDSTKQKIYTVDMRNHGDSLPYTENMTYTDMANDLRNFIDKIVLEKDQCDPNSVTLMGHSMGGKAAMCMSLDSNYIRRNLHKLIVADISPTTSPSHDSIKSYLNKMISIDMNSIDSSTIFAARKQVDAKLCELPALKQDPYQRQFLLTRLTQRNGKIAWNFNISSIINHVESIMQFPKFDTKFNNPTLFIGGELSNYITQKEEPAIANYFLNYKINKIPKAGHVIHFDNPTDTIAVINEFINQP